MPQYQGFKTVPKIAIDDKDMLSLVYTPGVGSSCLAISKIRKPHQSIQTS